MNRKNAIMATSALLAVASGASNAANVIVNGGFETGNFSGWTTNTLTGSNGQVFVSSLVAGASLPVSGQPAAGPAGGSYYAAVDQGGAGGYEFYQSFNVAAGSTVSYSFDLFARDASGVAPLNPDFFGPSPSGQAAQYVRVDILSGSTVLANLALLGTNNGYQNFAGDLTGLLGGGGLFTFRFRHLDNQLFYHTAIDNIMLDVNATVIPLPTAGALGLMGISAIGVRRRRVLD